MYILCFLNKIQSASKLDAENIRCGSKSFTITHSNITLK